MAELDLIVRGGRLAPSRARRCATIAVAGGVIVEIAERDRRACAEEIDASGLHVLAGGIDPHVHLDDPGRTHWEGFALGTCALAAGGVTTAIDMPLNASPPTVDARSFDLKLAAGSRASMIDFALWGGLIPGNLDDMDDLAARGVVGFKAFMCEGGLEDFPPADDLTLYEGMQRAAALGLLVGVHAENETITRMLTARARAAGRHAMRDWARARPIVAETEAIRRAIGMAEETGCALHVVHVSTGRGVALVTRGARSRSRCHVRGLPASPDPDRGGRRAAGHDRQVCAAAAPAWPRPRRSGRRSSRARCRWSSPTTRRCPPAPSGARTCSRRGAGSRRVNRRWSCC